MGRHTLALSDDWSTCTRCNQKLERDVCMCCGVGCKGVCWKYLKCKDGVLVQTKAVTNI